MSGLSSWLRRPQAFVVLTVLVGVNAVLYFATGQTGLGIVFAVLTVAVAVRAWRLWRAGAAPAPDP
jgi:hypothetical protein